jgi:cobalt-zinc-cadmium efflux system protein
MEAKPHTHPDEGHGHAHHGHHDHDHGGHHHGVVQNIRIAFFLNLGFAVLELVGGLLTNSMAIMTDALHDLGDAVGLGLAWYLEKLSAKRVDNTFTYGYARFSVLAALINSFILILGAVLLIVETIPRLLHPEAADAEGMLYLAILGVAVNGFAAWRLMRGNTLNERAVALHMLEDVLGWVAIIVGAIVMLFWDVPILDPILSCAILVFILMNVAKGLKKAFHIFLQGTPRQFDIPRLRRHLVEIPAVKDVHDLHVWTLDGQFHIASLHAVVSRDCSLAEAEQVKAQIRAALLSLQIKHATVEIESEDADCAPCALDTLAPHTHEGYDHDDQHDHHDHAH